MTRPPILTDAQRRFAYDKSLAIRRARAEAKRGLAEYGENPVELLAYLWDKEPVQGMHLFDLLCAMRGYGVRRATLLMERARINRRRKVQGVGPRQRDRLFELLAR